MNITNTKTQEDESGRTVMGAKAKRFGAMTLCGAQTRSEH